jgi:hypothetical protein
MPVNVKAITDERLQSWAKQLVDAHATPVLLVGVGHDHVSGQIHVVVTEDMTPVQIRAFLKAALKAFDK